MKKILIGILLSMSAFATEEVINLSENQPSEKCVFELFPNVMNYRLGKNLDKIEKKNNIKIRWTKYFIDMEVAFWRNDKNVPEGSTPSLRWGPNVGRNGSTVTSSKKVQALKPQFIIKSKIEKSVLREYSRCPIYKYTQYLTVLDVETGSTLDSIKVGNRFTETCLGIGGGIDPAHYNYRWFTNYDVKKFIADTTLKYCK
jgi:hypothetical protein